MKNYKYKIDFITDEAKTTRRTNDIKKISSIIYDTLHKTKDIWNDWMKRKIKIEINEIDFEDFINQDDFINEAYNYKYN